MRDRRPDVGPGLEPETRAEVARRRLAQLTTTFETAEAGGTPSHRATQVRGAHLRVVTVVAVAAGVLLTWWVLAERPRSADVTDPVELSGAGQTHQGPSAPAPSGGSPSASASSEVVVDVAGKVRRPGIVTLPAGSRVHQAIRAAGGTRGKVDLTGLNLARVLTDGEQVLVGVTSPGTGSAAPGAKGGTAAGGATGAAVNLNSATLEELDALPGVGPVTAQSIIDWRTENGRFRSVDDLLEVSGIGDKTLADLRDLVTV